MMFYLRVQFISCSLMGELQLTHSKEIQIVLDNILFI